MNYNKIFSAVLSLGFISLLSLSACKKDNDTTPQPQQQKANVDLRLTDAPAEYDAVYIDIQKVEVTMEGSAAVTLDPVRAGVYNLLEFRNGLDTLLLRADLPPGKIEQVRLILGSNNSVMIDGQMHMMNTPSAQQSGLKLNLNQEFEAGGSYTLWVDFDAAASIHETGNGKFQLKPVIRAYSSKTDGQIEGYVLPIAALTTVYVTNGVDTYMAIPENDGYFNIHGLPEGKYSVTFDASVLAYTDVTINNVDVTYGQKTDLGTTILVQ